MSTKLVGIGEIGISANPSDIVKTMALGSCVAVIFLAPKAKAAGLAHVALPDSAIGSQRTQNLPGYFADTAIPNLIAGFRKFGATRSSDLIIKLAGGASIMDPNGIFNIGKRNVLAIRKILWQNRLGAIVEDVGENFSRTVWIEVGTGRVFACSPRKGTWEL
jgi:chemotaxis protein CheD